MAAYKKWHLIDLELGVPSHFNADVIATAKRDLQPGEMLDGEGGYTVFGKLFPAKRSLVLGSLPLGLAHHLKVVRPVQALFAA